jgi:non-heme chloroperoxidase
LGSQFVRPVVRRDVLKSLLGLGLLLPSGAGSGKQATPKIAGVGRNMDKDIVMLHGANAGGWCFDIFRASFESQGFTCHAPDLIGHGKDKQNAATVLDGVGIADYRRQMAEFLGGFTEPPILLAHSMGAVIAQQLAAKGLAAKLILVSPAPRSGILPPTDAEKKLDQDLMTLGPFWGKVIDPIFDLARIYTLNRLPPDAQRSVFDKFGPESGRALFELFFWMFDLSRATAVDTKAVRCDVLCLCGSDDRIVSVATARATASAYPDATFWELDGHGHMLLLEPGAEDIARRIVDWI